LTDCNMCSMNTGSFSTDTGPIKGLAIIYQTVRPRDGRKTLSVGAQPLHGNDVQFDRLLD
jgi:hypothetical protein